MSRVRQRAALFAVLLGVTGCTSTGDTPIRAEGDYAHGPTGLAFPERVGPFERVSISAYDAPRTGIEVGYDYRSFDALVAFTVYVREPLRSDSGELASLEQQFGLEKAVITADHPGAEESWSRETAAATDGIALPGQAAQFEYDERFNLSKQPVLSRLYLFDRGGWFVKYRATYARDQAGEAESVLEELLAVAPWSKGTP